MKPILVQVMGMSPAVVTETMWALAHRAEPFRPEEVHIITTSRGRDQVDSYLDGQDGAIARFCSEWDTPRPARVIAHVVQRDGRDLDDIRSVDDNTAVADTVVRIVADLTRDPDSQLHASIAGGRKTMSFYLGYVMSLFGRVQDDVSHVLVRPEALEFCREFFYRTRQPTRLSYVDRGTNETVEFEASEAVIELAPIPIVPLREIVGQRHLERLQAEGYDALVSYVRDVVGFAKVRLEDGTRELVIGRQRYRLGPINYALYRLLAEIRHQRRPGVGPEGVGPGHEGWMTYDEWDEVGALAQRFALLYWDKDPDWLEKNKPSAAVPTKLREAIQSVLPNLQRELKMSLDNEQLFMRLKPQVTWDAFESTGGLVSRRTRVGLALDPDQVELVD